MTKSFAILRPGEEINAKPNQETDARSAITRGMVEYLEDLEFDIFGGRSFRFERVTENWSVFEENAVYPSAVVWSEDIARYDSSRLTPDVLSTDIEMPFGSFMMTSCEMILSCKISAWATDDVERSALVAMLESELSPTEWRYGLLLVLPHYFNAIASYELQTVQYFDTEIDATRRFKRADIVVEARVPVIRLKNFPKSRILADITVTQE